MSSRFLLVPVVLALTMGTASTSRESVSAQTAPPTAATTTLDDQAELAVTVYNSNLALVRDVRNVQIGRGVSDLHFMDIAATVIRGIADGCRLAGCALIGGETAEMPGMYAAGEYDLAGFCVGAVERKEIINGSKARAGDALIGIASSGPHANGYSLIRKILKDSGTTCGRKFGATTIGKVLMAPTRIYIKPVMKLINTVPVKALAHITGGGLTENIPRVIPPGLDIVIDTGSWVLPGIFQWLQEQGNVDAAEMYRVFNCGVGMVACVAAKDLKKALGCLTRAGESAWHIGYIRKNRGGGSSVIFT